MKIVCRVSGDGDWYASLVDRKGTTYYMVGNRLYPNHKVEAFWRFINAKAKAGIGGMTELEKKVLHVEPWGKKPVIEFCGCLVHSVEELKFLYESGAYVYNRQYGLTLRRDSALQPLGFDSRYRSLPRFSFVLGRERVKVSLDRVQNLENLFFTTLSNISRIGL